MKNVLNVSFFHQVYLHEIHLLFFIHLNFSEQFIRLLPNLFKYLTPLYILTKLFTPLFDLLLTSIVNNQSTKIFAAKCGRIADERLVKKCYQEVNL